MFKELGVKVYRKRYVGSRCSRYYQNRRYMNFNENIIPASVCVTISPTITHSMIVACASVDGLSLRVMYL